MSKKSAQKTLKDTAPVKSSPVSNAKFDKWAPLLILIAGVIAYHNIFSAPFVFDDRFHIVENARIRQFWPPWQLVLHTSRPVVNLSLAWNYALGKLDPAGYHLFNLCVHICAALALYGIVRRTFLSKVFGERWRSASTPLATLIALLWLVHPIQTESVTYTIQRGESLMGLFYLLTLYSVIRATNWQSKFQRDKSRPNTFLWSVAAVVCCLLGMGAKGGVMITAPLLALVYDRVFVSESWGETIRQRWRLYLALAATWISYPLMLAAAPEEWKESAGFGYGASPLQYAISQPRSIVHYLRLALWPDQLCLDYGWPLAKSAGQVLPQLCVVIALLAAAVIAWRKKSPLAFLAAWFFAILIPTSSFVPIADVVVEHRMYLSLAAVAALIVIGLFSLMERNQKSVWLIGGAIVVALTAVTIRRNEDYASKLTMWEDTVRKSPNNPRAQYDVAVSLEEAQRYDDALVHYRRAVEENPRYTDALTNLGHLLVITGHAGDSVPYLQQALAIDPKIAAAHNSLGLALAQEGRTEDAVAQWQMALQAKPDFAEPHNNLGIVFAQQGRAQEAIAQWDEAIKLDPGLADAHNNLAYLLAQQGRPRDAIQHYEQALALRPSYYPAQINLARVLSTSDASKGGNPARAITLAQTACQSSGNQDPSCLDILAGALASAGRMEEAAQTAASAIALARARGDQALVTRLQNNLDAYRGKAVRSTTQASGRP